MGMDTRIKLVGLLLVAASVAGCGSFGVNIVAQRSRLGGIQGGLDFDKARAKRDKEAGLSHLVLLCNPTQKENELAVEEAYKMGFVGQPQPAGAALPQDAERVGVEDPAYCTPMAYPYGKANRRTSTQRQILLDARQGMRRGSKKWTEFFAAGKRIWLCNPLEQPEDGKFILALAQELGFKIQGDPEQRKVKDPSGKEGDMDCVGVVYGAQGKP